MAALGLAAGACGKKEAAPLPDLPLAIGDWKRTSVTVKNVSEAPETARALEPASWSMARYEGGGRTLTVDAYAFPNETLAFEAQQKWRRGDGVTTFYRGNAFAVCASEQLGTPEIVQFARQLEALWLGSSTQ